MGLHDRVSDTEADTIQIIEWHGVKLWKVRSGRCEDCVVRRVMKSGKTDFCPAVDELPWRTCGSDNWTDDIQEAITARLKK